jgi:transporter family protein
MRAYKIIIRASKTYSKVYWKKMGKLRMEWLVFALLSAITAALVAIFGKIGLEGVDSITATGIRAGIMFAAILLLMGFTGRIQQIASVNQHALFYIFLGGLAGAASWIFYFLALKYGQATQVASIDRLSVVFVLVFAALFLAEKITLPKMAGVALITAGAIIIAIS